MVEAYRERTGEAGNRRAEALDELCAAEHRELCLECRGIDSAAFAAIRFACTSNKRGKSRSEPESSEVGMRRSMHTHGPKLALDFVRGKNRTFHRPFTRFLTRP